MKIHRSRPESGFTQIPNDTLRDPALSYAARGVLAEILSRPDDWQTNAVAIAARARAERAKAGEGRRAILAVFAELATARYLFRLKHRDRAGHIVTELHIFDEPQECDPDGLAIYFRLAEQLTGVPPSGMPVRPAQTRVSAGRTDTPLTGTPVTGTPVTGTPVGGTSLRRPVTKKDTKTEEEDAGDENPSVLTSPVPVEGSGNGEVKPDFDFIPGDFGRPAGLTDEQWQDIAWLARPAAEIAEQHRRRGDAP